MSKPNKTNEAKIVDIYNQNIKFGHNFWQKAKQVYSGCYEWQGSILQTGYGQVSVPGIRSPQRAHRVAWLISGGTIPDGHVLRHLCNNRKCVNPNHLTTGTMSENTQDAVKAGRMSVPRTKTSPTMMKAIKILRLLDPKTFTLAKLSDMFDKDYLTVQRILRSN